MRKDLLAIPIVLCLLVWQQATYCQAPTDCQLITCAHGAQKNSVRVACYGGNYANCCFGLEKRSLNAVLSGNCPRD